MAPERSLLPAAIHDLDQVSEAHRERVQVHCGGT